ncbi:MAG: mannose-1-phosphate guanyltransferase [Chloroflexi bacterium]|nr:MAG: mannose-1-phosphate guanyltransferase [Phototrophicales bacterium]RMF76935.1 MAG: mannose-1-phosphate guanyltransferase [Chloroflexota bacterium]
MKHYYAMIMAGGGGTRLWPMSRKANPKQMLALVEESSMFKVSVDRLAPIFPPERIFIVTGSEYVDTLRAEAPHVPAENFVIEPYGKNSGPAAALGIIAIQNRDPDAIIAILTADHHIADKQEFCKVLAAGYELAQQNYIVTLGITPTVAATGFGYIRQGDVLGEVRGYTCYHSRGFTEKPNREKAQQFLASGEYSWNSGMFIWRSEQAMREFYRQQPAMYGLLQELSPTIGTPKFKATLAEVWDRMPNISLDYAIMEHAERMAVIPVDMGWSDIGSWASLFEVLTLDENGNYFKGVNQDSMIVDTRRTLVYSDKLTVTIGVKDLVVVDTDDVLFICHRDQSQDVKEVVQQLRAIQNGKYL